MNTTTKTNPQTVIVRQSDYTSQHGLKPGSEYPVLYPEIEAKDSNGYSIYIMSPAWQRPIWLSSYDYNLKPKQ